MHYRTGFADAVAAADGVVVISDDTRDQLALERLRIDAERCPRRAQRHRPPDRQRAGRDRRPTCSPAAPRRRRSCSSSGPTTPTRTVISRSPPGGVLLKRGHQLALVIVGAAVPYGSSRVTEAVEQARRRGSTSCPTSARRSATGCCATPKPSCTPRPPKGSGSCPTRRRSSARPPWPCPSVRSGRSGAAQLAVAERLVAGQPGRCHRGAAGRPGGGRRPRPGHPGGGYRVHVGPTADGLVTAYRTVLARPRR